MPTIRLEDDAVALLQKYRWGGNIRQLRNIAEQISVLEQERVITAEDLKSYLPDIGSNLPAVISEKKKESDFSNEREILYKVLFDMKRDLNDLKKLTLKLMENGNHKNVKEEHEGLIEKLYGDNEQDAEMEDIDQENMEVLQIAQNQSREQREQREQEDKYHFAEEIEEEEPLSLHDKELELIKKSLDRHHGKRKNAADELGISERTLYRKIKQYNL